MIIYENPQPEERPHIAYYLVDKTYGGEISCLSVEDYKKRVISNSLAALSLDRVTLEEVEVLISSLYYSYPEKVTTDVVKTFRKVAFYDPEDGTDKDLVSLRKNTLTRAAAAGHLTTPQLIAEFDILDEWIGATGEEPGDIWVTKDGLQAALPYRDDTRLTPIEEGFITPDHPYYRVAQEVGATHWTYRYVIAEEHDEMVYKGAGYALGIMHDNLFVPTHTPPDLIGE